VVWARVPDEQEHPGLRATILKFNMHSKDHLERPTNRCNKKGRCMFGFPFDVNPTTSLTGDDHVLYRRTTEGDHWVVSYMPRLSQFIDCHVNVDICFTANVFMYFYKYLFKGPNRTHFTLREQRAQNSEEPVDEIKDYVTARYLSASEAAWWILSYHITRKDPAVTSIYIHLPNTNFSRMHRTDGSSPSGSLLLRYFARPSDGRFDDLTITDYYNRYRLAAFNRGVPLDENREWLEVQNQSFPVQKVVLRSSGSRKITHLHSILPRMGELYFLHSLLIHKPARSFDDLRTISSVHHPSFWEAAIALGLFTNHSEGFECLRDAVQAFSSPSQLRFLFAQILLNLPCSAVELLTTFQEDLAADYLDRGLEPSNALTSALFDIDSCLRSAGSSLRDFSLPDPPEHHLSELDAENLFFNASV